MREFLHQGEHIIQSTPGAIDIGTLDVLWRPGNLHLTNQRLIFERQGRVQFATFLKDIVDVKLEMRKWILQHIRQLCISYRARHSDSVRVAYMALRSPVGWQKLIKDRMTLALLKGHSPCHPDPERSEGEESDAQDRLRKGKGLKALGILRGVYPEPDSSVASLPQNDKRRRAQSLQQGE